MSGPAPEVGTATQTDHPFQVDGEWWERCRVCGFGAPAHATTAVGLGPDPNQPYRCPDCVTRGREKCPHDILRAEGGLRA